MREDLNDDPGRNLCGYLCGYLCGGSDVPPAEAR